MTIEEVMCVSCNKMMNFEKGYFDESGDDNKLYKCPECKREIVLFLKE